MVSNFITYADLGLEPPVKATSLPEPGLILCKLFEGFSSRPYQCSAGVWTIGYGSTYYENGKAVSPSDSEISQTEADELYQAVMERDFWKPLLRNIPSLSKMNSNQQGALLSFSYNTGWNRLNIGSFDTLDRAIVAGAGVPQALKLYDNGGLLGLVRRRAAEGWMFEGMPAQDAFKKSQDLN